MSYLENFHELNDSAHTARELSEKLNFKINRCLDNLEEYLKDNTKCPAMVEPYEPIE